MAAFKLGELLIKANVLQESQLKSALMEQQRWGGKLGEILVRMGMLTEDLLTRALSKQLGVPAINLSNTEKPPPDVLSRIPVRIAEDLRVLPLQLKDDNKTLVVATADPLAVQDLDSLRVLTRCRISPVLVGRTVLDRAMTRFYHDEGHSIPPPSDSDPFKVVDAQGRTLVKSIQQLKEEAAHAPRAGQGGGSTAPPTQNDARSLLQAVEDVQRKEVAALKALVELLVERGLFTREEYVAKVRR